VLAGPLRLVVDFVGVARVRRSVEGAGVITRARASQFDPATVRLVIDLAQPMRIIGVTQSSDHRLSVELAPISLTRFTQGLGKRAVVTSFKPEPSSAPRPSAIAREADFDLPDGALQAVAILPKTVASEPIAKSEPVVITLKPAPLPITATPLRPARSGKLPLVMIDAGHGGKDVGAISALGGRYEKDVTLAIAKAAAAALEKSGLVRVRLTRSDDRFIPLGGRVAIARAARADLFISVHADSAANQLARGASVYTLSETASDAVAARLAARENTADIIAGVNFGVVAPGVSDIMIDLARRDTMNSSAAFADILQANLNDSIAFRGEFHHFAGFFVLKAPDIPSVLLETGYLSNLEDADLLFSAKGQRVIGEGIARAVETFLRPALGNPR
jgi:N-acetylmuramoyl-L-alanine amidase